jgi:formate dehydrogenase subunit gamma
MSREPYLLPNGRVLRYSFHERLVHWLAGVSYVYLLLTGLAFWSPGSFGSPSSWVGQRFRASCILGSAVFVVGVSLMYNMWHRQMKETPADKAWWASIGHYIRNEDDQIPSADRFNPGQKLLFWGFFWNGMCFCFPG